MWTLAQAFAAVAHLRGAHLVGAADAGARVFTRVHTDTRTLASGDLYVALSGERFDGQAFLPQAHAAGAAAAVATHGLSEAGLPGIEVADPLAALQTLAGAWRSQFDLPLIAVAGSNGKTTVTQMVAAILRAAWSERSLATAGNFNNHIGVPLTLLGLRDTHRAAVVELGMNHPGEIAELAALARPTVAVVNNAQREHQEFMASVEAVARENGSVLAALPLDGVAVYPQHDAHAGIWRELSAGRRALTFDADGASGDGGHGPAGVRAQAQWVDTRWRLTLATAQGDATLWLHAPGRHNVHNALAAAAAGMAAGVPLATVARGLEAFRPVSGRSEACAWAGIGQPVPASGVLINDTYNANPDSVRAAIDVLASLPAPRWLVLGDMGEVGESGPAFHAEVGAHAQAAGIDALWCVGPLCAHAAQAFGAAARHFASVEALLQALPDAPQAASCVVKGSRFMAMERVVNALLHPLPTAQAGGVPCS